MKIYSKLFNWAPHKHKILYSFLSSLFCAVAWLRSEPLSSLMSSIGSDNYVRSENVKNIRVHANASWMLSSVYSSAPLEVFQLDARTLIRHHEATLSTSQNSDFSFSFLTLFCLFFDFFIRLNLMTRWEADNCSPTFILAKLLEKMRNESFYKIGKFFSSQRESLFICMRTFKSLATCSKDTNQVSNV